MDSVRSKLKNKIKDLAAQVAAKREEISVLKWKEGAKASALKRLRSRDPATQGRKNKLKELARPETGPQRENLWVSKREIGSHARCCLLIYGFLRGLPYRRIEPTTTEKVYAGTLHRWLSALLTEDQKKLLPPDAFSKWYEGEPAPSALLEAIRPTRSEAQVAG